MMRTSTRVLISKVGFALWPGTISNVACVRAVCCADLLATARRGMAAPQAAPDDLPRARPERQPGTDPGTAAPKGGLPFGQTAAAGTDGTGRVDK